MVQTLYAKEQQATHSRQRELAAAIEQGEQVLRNRIKEWSPEYEGKLIEFGVGYGLTADDVRQAKSAPGQIELLHLARIGAESLQQRATVQRHEQAQTTQPAPPVKGGSAPSNRDPSNMDFADFEKWARNREAKAG